MSEEESDNSNQSNDENAETLANLVKTENGVKRNELMENIDRTMNLLSDIESIESLYIRNDPIYEEVNGYIVGELLGNGSFGQVKEFVHKRSLKRFAAKIMNMDTVARRGEEYDRNIKLEINLVRNLNHKNVIKANDYFRIDSFAYLILEYCYSVLSEYLESKTESGQETHEKLPISQSHYYFCQLIEGLQYLHGLGIIHHDIKPANLLIDNSNTLKITDFGTCTVIDNFTESDDIDYIYKGTFGYMCPEMMAGEVVRLNGPKCDIWSSGVTLFQMITGKLPYPNIVTLMLANEFDIDDLEYPSEIMEDLQLLNLLEDIFVLDFKERLSLEAIKNHPWFLLEFPIEDFVKPEPKLTGDIYRSLTVMPYIQSHFYPLNIVDEDREVTEEEYNEHLISEVTECRANALREGQDMFGHFGVWFGWGYTEPTDPLIPIHLIQHRVCHYSNKNSII